MLCVVCCLGFVCLLGFDVLGFFVCLFGFPPHAFCNIIVGTGILEGVWFAVNEIHKVGAWEE